MMLLRKVMLVFGTRPEAIKMAPIVHELRRYPDFFQVIITVTGQHREMLDQVLGIFGISPDFDLNIMQPGQDLFGLSSNILLGLRPILRECRPNVVLVHGDTTTSTFASIAAFYEQITVCHVEAGLRTHNVYSPWPEEMNRQLTGRLANYHFAPTEKSKQNLLSEMVQEKSILVTGNTVIDALKMVLKKIDDDHKLAEFLEFEIESKGYKFPKFDKNLSKKIVLITGHRRENFGESFLQILMAIKKLSNDFPEVDFVYPMHLNPNVRTPIKNFFGDNEQSNIYFIEPLEYLSFVYFMTKSYLILTDSGGIQEEAPSLNKPVLVMRDSTERPEALEAGTVKLVGTSCEKIFLEVSKLLTDKNEYNLMVSSKNPYGDGLASQRISNFLKSMP